MANSSKAKGDRAEREAVKLLVGQLPEHVLPQSKRILGAGREEDVGDLFVFPDVAVQVKNFKASNLGSAILSAASGAEVQAANGGLPYALGLVKIPGAREGTVKWMAVVPAGAPNIVEFPSVVTFSQVSKLVKWLRDDVGPEGYRTWPKDRRIASFTASRDPRNVPRVMPLEAWSEVYVSSVPTLAERSVSTMGSEFHLRHREAVSAHDGS